MTILVNLRPSKSWLPRTFLPKTETPQKGYTAEPAGSLRSTNVCLLDIPNACSTVHAQEPSIGNQITVPVLRNNR